MCLEPKKTHRLYLAGSGIKAFCEKCETQQIVIFPSWIIQRFSLMNHAVDEKRLKRPCWGSRTCSRWQSVRTLRQSSCGVRLWSAPSWGQPQDLHTHTHIINMNTPLPQPDNQTKCPFCFHSWSEWMNKMLWCWQWFKERELGKNQWCLLIARWTTSLILLHQSRAHRLFNWS